MILFGPSGRDELTKKIDVLKIPQILADLGLYAFEYAFTHGVRINDENAIKFGCECKKYNVSLSVHAPYYISLTTSDPIKQKNNIIYFEQCIKKMKLMGAKVLVFHPGSLFGQTREHAFSLCKKNLKEIIMHLREAKLLNGIYLCPETMGKLGQIGTIDEIIELCNIDKNLVPTLDFGHINSFTGGQLKQIDDFKLIFDKVNTFLEKQKKDRFHIHFSKIKYGIRGEIKHLKFNELGEPDYHMFISALKNYSFNVNVICESSGSQISDAVVMKNLYQNLNI